MRTIHGFVLTLLASIATTGADAVAQCKTATTAQSVRCVVVDCKAPQQTARAQARADCCQAVKAAVVRVAGCCKKPVTDACCGRCTAATERPQPRGSCLAAGRDSTPACQRSAQVADCCAKTRPCPNEQQASCCQTVTRQDPCCAAPAKASCCKPEPATRCCPAPAATTVMKQPARARPQKVEAQRSETSPAKTKPACCPKVAKKKIRILV